MTSRVPGPTGFRHHQAIDAGTLERTKSPAPHPNGAGASHPDTPDADMVLLRELALDLIQMALDIAGIFDPTPISDGASALMSLARGNWLDAVISGASMIPYVGDLAKAGKLPRYLKSVEKAVELAERSAQAAKQLLPGFRKLKEILDKIPTGANQELDKIRRRIDQFLASHSIRAVEKLLPDIRSRFVFRSPRVETIGGKRYVIREAEGPLGIPGTVQNHGIPRKTQQSISGGSGDDAGHLIGGQFGAPSDARNLSKQNWRQNEGGGTWHDMERAWSEKLKSGTGIKVKVKEFTPEGSTRPLWREVEWQEIAPNGTVTKHTSPKYLNTHTADAPHRDGSRTQQKVPPTVNSPQTDNVYDFKTGKKL